MRPIRCKLPCSEQASQSIFEGDPRLANLSPITMTDHEHKPEPVDDLRPFQIQLAERMNRLPAYLFARLNQMMYQTRRAGVDVIDMGMGNPTDPPADMIIDKL